MRKLPAVFEDLEQTINASHHIGFDDVRPAQPRAMGSASLRIAADSDGTSRLQKLRHAGSSKLVFPRSHGQAIEVIAVNTAGGITGGDTFTLDAAVGAHGMLTLTTQAAERAYRAQRGETGEVTTRLAVENGASLNWLPQELILFDRCALKRRLDVTLGRDARFLMVEPIVFGRTAMGEKLSSIHFQDRIRITREGRAVYHDGVDMIGNAASRLANRAIAHGAGAMASLVLIRPDAAAQLKKIRNMLPPMAGASLIAEDVMVLRHLAMDGYSLRRDLMSVLNHLTDNSLPISWRL